jgi:hypothetical protein
MITSINIINKEDKNNNDIASRTLKHSKSAQNLKIYSQKKLH